MGFKETVPADVIGRDCADSLGGGAPLGAAVSTLANEVGVDDGRMRFELFALEVCSTEFALASLLDDEDVRDRTLSAFYEQLATQDMSWAEDFNTIGERHGAYVSAFVEPHPELGRGFRVGQCFASSCDRENDIRLIHLAAALHSQIVTNLATLLADVEVS